MLRFFQNLLPQKLLTRTLVILILTLLVVQGVSILVFHLKHWRWVNYKLSDNLAGDITFLYQEMETDNDFIAVYNQKARKLLNIHVKFQTQPITIARSSIKKNKQRTRLERYLGRNLKRPFRVSYENPEIILVEVKSEQYDGYYIFTIPDGRVFSNTTEVFLNWIVGSGLILTLIAAIFLNMQIRPLVRLARAADEVGKGRNFDGDNEPNEIKLHGALEIQTVIRSFNRMLKRLYYQLRQRTIMLAGVSHDLRTPLTKMRLQMALFQQELSDLKNLTIHNRKADDLTKNVDNCQDGLQKMAHNLSDMENMIALYLQFARGEGSEKLKNVVISKFITQLISEWQSYKIKNVKLSFDIAYKFSNKMEIKIREQAIHRCLNNIIENALKNATEVLVTITRDKENLLFLIADNGRGVPESERERIFHAFYQLLDADNSTQKNEDFRQEIMAKPVADKRLRSKVTASKNKIANSPRGKNINKINLLPPMAQSNYDIERGVGLGLAIARDIATAHGGNITVGISQQGGALFTLSIPL